MAMQKKVSARKAPSTKASAGKAAGKPPASTKPLWQKLFVKSGTVMLINAPPGYEKHFAGSPATITTRRAGMANTVLVFANDAKQLDDTLPSAIARLGPGATLWVAYRKGDKTFHRDTLARQVNAHGYTGVALVAIDDVWSALRVKPR